MTYNAGKHIPQPDYMRCKKCRAESDKNSYSSELRAALCKKCAKAFGDWKAKKQKSGNAFFTTDFLK